MTTLKHDEEYYEYLDQLRESGITNMFGAAPYLREEFPDLDRQMAKEIVLDWMHTFGKRHLDVGARTVLVLD